MIGWLYLFVCSYFFRWDRLTHSLMIAMAKAALQERSAKILPASWTPVVKRPVAWGSTVGGEYVSKPVDVCAARPTNTVSTANANPTPAQEYNAPRVIYATQARVYVSLTCVNK